MINLLSSELLQPFIAHSITGVILTLLIVFFNAMRVRDISELRNKMNESNEYNKEQFKKTEEYFTKIETKQENTIEIIRQLETSIIQELKNHVSEKMKDQTEKNDLKYQKK